MEERQKSKHIEHKIISDKLYEGQGYSSGAQASAWQRQGPEFDSPQNQKKLYEENMASDSDCRLTVIRSKEVASEARFK